jgi:DNA-binding PadR family transcriptional regulator
VILGFIELHILYHASKEPITGSFMMKELKRHGYSIGPGTIYPLLHKMEKFEVLTSRWEIKDGKRIRVYEITPKGFEILEEGKKKVRELYEEILDE